jgi:hypothetical protein
LGVGGLTRAKPVGCTIVSTLLQLAPIRRDAVET